MFAVSAHYHYSARQHTHMFCFGNEKQEETSPLVHVGDRVIQNDLGQDFDFSLAMDGSSRSMHLYIVGPLVVQVLGSGGYLVSRARV